MPLAIFNFEFPATVDYAEKLRTAEQTMQLRLMRRPTVSTWRLKQMSYSYHYSYQSTTQSDVDGYIWPTAIIHRLEFTTDLTDQYHVSGTQNDWSNTGSGLTLATTDRMSNPFFTVHPLFNTERTSVGATYYRRIWASAQSEPDLFIGRTQANTYIINLTVRQILMGVSSDEAARNNPPVAWAPSDSSATFSNVNVAARGHIVFEYD